MYEYIYYDIISLTTIVKFVETTSLYKLLLHRASDQRKTWLYCRVTDGKSHEGVYGRRIDAPEKMTTEISSLMEKDGMLFVRLRIVNMRFWTL